MFSTDATTHVDYLGGDLVSEASEDDDDLEEDWEEDSEPVASGSEVDFNALMSQTTALLASGEIEGDIDPPNIDDKNRVPGAEGPSALLNGILDALDIVDPPAANPEPEEKANPEQEEKDGLDEWEKDVLANMDVDGPTTIDAATGSPTVSPTGAAVDPDEEIEFID